MRSLLRRHTVLPDQASALPSKNVYRYEIVNLTSYGGDTGFPILTEATLWGLRLVHRDSSGVAVDVPLYDSDGVRQVDLDSNGVYLRSEAIDPPSRTERVEIVLTGRIRPTRLETSAVNGRQRGTIDACSAFSLECAAVPGLYETISITDLAGNRYPIGTLSVLMDDVPSPDTFAELSRAAGRSTVHGQPLARQRSSRSMDRR